MADYSIVEPSIAGETSYVWLLGNGPVPPDPVSKASLQAACVFALENWQVLPTVWDRLEKWAGSKLAASEIAQSARDRVAALKVLARIQKNLLERYISALVDEHIPYVLLKGTAARVMAYPDSVSRCGVDLDLGVPKPYIYDAERIAMEQGFVQSEWQAHTKRFVRADQYKRGAVEENHYELGFLARDQVIDDLDEDVAKAIRRDLPFQEPWHETTEGELACYVTLDLHHSLTLASDLDGTLATSAVVEQDAVTYRVPSLPWLAFHITEKLYMEGVAVYRKGGYQFADLIRVVNLLDNSSSKLLVDIFSKHIMEIPAYYVFSRLVTEFGMALPSPILGLLEKHRLVPERGKDAYQLNDLGDPWAKLWGNR